MKYLLTLTIITCLTACNKSERTDDNKIVEALTKTNPTDNNDILGQWTMCSTSGNGVMITANVCATVNFGSYGTGSVTHASGPSEMFTWTFKSDTLRISNLRKDSSHTFYDTVYTALIAKEKKWN
jgi:hypothetical protein